MLIVITLFGHWEKLPCYDAEQNIGKNEKWVFTAEYFVLT